MKNPYRIVNGIEVKRCSDCKKWLYISLFSRNRTLSDGLSSVCKQCNSLRLKEYHSKNKGKGAEYRTKNKGKIKEWRSKNKGKIKEYRIKNKESWVIYQKVYRSKNKEKRKKWRSENKENEAIYLKLWRKKNPEKIIIAHNLWRKANKETLNKREREKTKTDLKYKLNKTISRAIRGSLKNGKGGNSWKDLVPYTIDDLIKRLKKTLPKGYKWRDYVDGKTDLHVDHILPIAVHNFKSYKDTDFQRCWALKNLQLLPAKENMSKGAKLTKHFQPSLLL